MDPRPTAPGRLTVILAAALLCIVWGSTWLVIKTGLASLPVLSSAAARFTLAGLMLVVLAPLLHRREGGRSPSWRFSAWMGLFNFAIPYGVVYQAETVLPSGLTAVLWAVFPLFTAWLGHRWLPDERMNRRQWLGMGLGLVGVGSLFVTDLRTLGPDAVAYGALLLLSPLSAAFGQVMVKRHGTALSASLLNRNGMVIGAAALWLVALPLEHDRRVVLTTEAALSVTYLALVGTVLTFGLYFWLLRFVPGNRLSLIAFVTPAIALWAGWALGGEPLTLSTVGGSVLIALGIGLALRGRDSPDDSSTPDRASAPNDER